MRPGERQARRARPSRLRWRAAFAIAVALSWCLWAKGLPPKQWPGRVAFALVLVLAASFAGVCGAASVARWQRQRKDDAEALAAARARARRDAQMAELASRTVVAANALTEPLTAVARAAAELQRLATPSACEQAHILEREVARCWQLLGEIRTETASAAGDAFAHVRPGSFVRAALRDWAQSGDVAVQVDPAADKAMYVPPRCVERSLRAVVRRALEGGSDAWSSAAQSRLASPSDTAQHVGRPSLRAPRRVAVRVAQVEKFCYISVAHGDAEAAAHLTDGRATSPLEPGTARVSHSLLAPAAEGGGADMGLYLARDVAERLGGSLRIVSEQGFGPTVVLRLPVVDPPAEAR